MINMKRVLLTAALLVSMAAGVFAAETHSPMDHTTQSAVQWTKYDWNASSGKSDVARFAIEGEKEAVRLHITASTPDDARFVREVAVEPATIYHFASRVRTENVGTKARGAGISVSGILGGSRDITGTSAGWQTVDFFGKTGTEQRRLSVTVGVGGYGSLNSGSAWFEDITVEKATSVPPGVTVASLEPLAVRASVPPPQSSKMGGNVIAAFVCLGAILVAVGLFGRRRSGGKGSDGNTSGSGGNSGGTGGNATGGIAEEGGEKAERHAATPGGVSRGAQRSDVAVMAALTVVCLAVSLFNLGGHVAPDTGWQAAAPEETVTVELGREVELSRFYYYCGINDRSGDDSRFALAARNAAGAFVPLLSFTKNDSSVWKFSEIAVRTSAIRLTADTAGGRLNEIALVEKGRRIPLSGLRIGERQVSAKDVGKPENLIDEQAAFEYAPSFRTGFYFDEIYHGRTAWEMLHGIEPYETTHPPLGKLLISAGIALFGMNPFGWRIVGTLFGVALVPLTYLFGLKLFRNRFYAFGAAFLMMFDFMRFAQSRVAVIDVYGVFFILVMYYFILDLFPEAGERPTRSTNATLLLTGVAFGVGAACKWIAVYAGGGIALLVVLKTVTELKRRNFSPGQGAAGFLLKRVAVCVLTLAVVPAVIYLLAYLPYLALPGAGHDLAGVFRLQAHMLNYHRTLQATHPFSSQWWSWPLDLRPMWMYTGQGLPAGIVSSIASFGNPAIFWLAIPAVAGAAFLAVSRRDARIGVVLTALLFQYLPWVGINRLAFIYHFFSSVPFVIFCIVAILKSLELQFPRFRTVTWGYLVITAGLFVLFYPVLSGLPVREGYMAGLKWLPTWLF